MSFFLDKISLNKTKDQGDPVITPADIGPGVIISPDTQRQNRIPAGSRERRNGRCWMPSGPPKIDLDTWKLRIFGMVGQAVEWNWPEFLALPRVRVFSDFHCVTRWSRLGNTWEGVSTKDLLSRAGGADSKAGFVLAHGYDRGFTTNLPLADFGRRCARRHQPRWRADLGRSRRTGPAHHPSPVRLEEREVAVRHRIDLDRPARLLGKQRLPHARRPMGGTTLQLVG